MTIWRVNVDVDEAMLVAKNGTRVKDKDLERALKEMSILQKVKDEVASANQALERAKAAASQSVKVARLVYTLCDNRLKEKDLSKDDRGELVFVRKMAYDFTMEMKKTGIA